MDCQDWLLWFVEHLVQRKIIGVEALQATKAVTDSKEAPMPAPGGEPTISNQPSAAVPSPAAVPITASLVSRSILVQRREQPQPQAQSTSSERPAKPQVGQSEWMAEKSRFER